MAKKNNNGSAGKPRKARSAKAAQLPTEQKVNPALFDLDDYVPGEMLTWREKAFCDAYMGPARRVAAEAVRMANYGGKSKDDHKTIGMQVLSRAHVQAYLARKQQSVKYTVDDILTWYGIRGKSSMADFLTFGMSPLHSKKTLLVPTWWIDLHKANEAAALGQIKKLERREWPDGSFTVKIELWDAQRGVDKLAEHFGVLRTDDKRVSQILDGAAAVSREWGDREMLEYMREQKMPVSDVLGPRWEDFDVLNGLKPAPPAQIPEGKQDEGA